MYTRYRLNIMKKENKWHGVRLPEGLMKEIEKTIIARSLLG